ncbi:hypothetical protein Tco_0603472 [Tanacetum coccineum]
MHTEPTRHADLPSLDAELPLTDSEMESDEEVPVINAEDQDEVQAGPNLSEQDEGQARPNPDQVILEEPASSTGTFSSLQNLDKDLSFTNQFFVEKPHEEEPGKTNAKAEVQSMVLVSIHQDTSSVPPMTTLVSKAVDEIVTDAVDWAMQAPLRARFRDLPTIYMKEFFNNGSDQEEARKKKRKRRESPRTPLGSPPTQPPPLPPPAGTSGAPGTSGASRSSQLPPPPLPPSTSTSGSAQ